MTNYLNKASRFTKTVIEVAKSNGYHDFVEQACNKESQARFLENIKSFGATDRTGAGNTQQQVQVSYKLTPHRFKSTVSQVV